MLSNFVFVVLVQLTVGVNSLTPSPILATSSSAGLSLHEQSLGNSKIFGIRWMLGNSFSLEKQYRNSQRFLMMFNSRSKIEGSVILKIMNSPITCSYHTVELNNQSSYIYRCNINFHLPHNQVNYQIIKEETVYYGEQQNMTLKYEPSILYQGRLRVLLNKVVPIFLGHFNVSNMDEQGILENQVVGNKNINLGLLSGSFIPQLNQSNYQALLMALEVLSAVMPVAFVSLNLEQNQLFSQLFSMPQAEIYYSNFWMLSLPNSLVVMGVNPLICDQNNKDSYLSQICGAIQASVEDIALQLAANVHFFLAIGPNFNNILNRKQNPSHFSQKGYEKLLSDQKVTLYMSYQQNGYFRTSLDQQHLVNQSITDYSFDFPVTVNQGFTAVSQSQHGNYDFYSSSTGFGILSFSAASNNTLIQLSYKHFSYKSAQIEDSFVLKSSLNRDNNIQFFIAKIRNVTITIEFTFLLLMLSFMGYIYFKLRPMRRRDTGTDHIEMVQEAHNNPPNQLRQPISL